MFDGRQSRKFEDPFITAEGKPRAYIRPDELETLWFNTGTLCNIECKNCYIESSPRNDRLVYITFEEVCAFLDEIREFDLKTRQIGLTGGEPFMNRDIIKIISESLERGFETLVLTNAMRPMMRFQDELIRLKNTYGDKLVMRVSVDHYRPELHEDERGPKTWEPMLKGLKWLSDNNFTMDIAGRTRWNEDEKDLRKGYAAFFKEHAIDLDADDTRKLVLFPEMEEKADVPEITTDCWNILGITPQSIMCSNSRMVIKRKGDYRPSVQACTLLPYEKEFELGRSLKESLKDVYLNHPHCSKFCVLGGGSCTKA